ncbi:MAG: alkyl hydroperoxide reductase/Thiol specific antioxidant/Mal allergen [Flavipsychrobacter sp.]|jgi:hypothetical protein|nr:alkyl hydroperoxide reductase/Thiol specific antioxidant/Mal allergen [Flavipsychrobacter sp.]
MARRVFFSLVFCLFANSLFAQNANYPPPPDPREWAKDSIKPYQKNPMLPAFNIMLMDSATIFNTYNIPAGKVTAMVFFDPTCKHCKSSIGGLMQGMDSVKDVQFYFFTLLHDYKEIRNFYEKYKMAEHPNIKAMGRDYEFFFVEHYRVLNLPDVALYDGRKKLIKLLEGDFSATKIYNAIQESKK